MIELKNVTKRFGLKAAVEDVSFEVKAGEILGFLGPNGAGKTTTMRLITGFFPADEGQIIVDGLKVGESPVEVKRRIGYLPEDNPLYHFLKVREYLRFIAEVRGITDQSQVEEMIEVCGIQEVLKKEIQKLSKGYRQRVGLAAAMLHKPPVLIMDEPTSGLDPNQIVEIRELIKELGKEKTVILSTHILSEVELTCNRVIIISHGKIVGQGNLRELTTDADKTLEEVFRELTLPTE
ncbi:multidrug ABC transporter ATP-binding protein [candidate division CPR3 bacterium 4484_211]|uniref:Multidrug ABC transporter ATP-binding protein n=1 Tax=candidate division CPR3 bacterium 4484_211 TaxID=1968527 RepID=A0A1W9NYV9_UNCC3|nr:MAG: multidrug ABC transporter ATP-binding protein [candidate division CPR3 bacterium 4484_211]